MDVAYLQRQFEEITIIKSNECRAEVSKNQGKEIVYANSATLHVIDDGSKSKGKAKVGHFFELSYSLERSY